MVDMTEEERDLRDRLIHNPDDQSDILTDWVHCDATMRARGQEKCLPWPGQLPKLGEDVLLVDGRVGTVCDYSYGELPDRSYQRCVWVRLAASQYEKVLADQLSVVDPVELDRRRKQEDTFKKKLASAGKKIEREQKERRAIAVQGSHLLDSMLGMLSGLDVNQKAGFHKITGSAKGKAIYIATKGGRMDLNGFTVDHPAIQQVSADEAKKRHIGRVRGQMDFARRDEDILAAFELALEQIR
jgi:hypothetical protein